MESAAQTLVGNAGQLLAAEYQLLRGVGGQAAELRDDLAIMNALLRMQSEAEDGALDHFVQECMKQLRELAYDVEDSVDHYKLRVKSRPGDGVGAWLRRLVGTVFLRRRLGCEISTLRARAITISERHARYGVNREALRRPLSLPPAPMGLVASASAHALRPTNHYRIVGIKDQADKLVQKLKGQVNGEQDLKVFSFVGFGGVGKTTLAMEVCRRLETEFPYQAFVSVSQAFEPSRDLIDLLKRVFRQITNTKTKNENGIKEEGAVINIDGWDNNRLVQELEKCLDQKRYLVVIDDVWTTRAWEAIEQALPDSKCGSRIIVTTRILPVAKECSPSTDCIHSMKPLNYADSKKLFLSRVFGSSQDGSSDGYPDARCHSSNGSSDARFPSPYDSSDGSPNGSCPSPNDSSDGSPDAHCPKELEEVMDDILKKCGGLPLAIVSIASVLAAYRSPGSIDKWEMICRSIGSQMESHPTLEGMKHILTLSYNHLPNELKGCMMYLSIFPEDYEINKKRLLRRWIAEGLVLEKRGLTLMEVAEWYLDELVSRNMIQPCDFHFDGTMLSVRVHDMLLEVMVSKALECNFVSLLGGQYAAMSYGRIRRLSIQGGDEKRPQGGAQLKKRAEGGIEGIDKGHVRSFSMFQQSENKLLDHLDKFTLLRVLDLESCEGLKNKHVHCICKLYLLTYLNLQDTPISKLPPQIGNLEHLQVLSVLSTNLVKLPETVTNLEKLEHIYYRSRDGLEFLWSLPRGLEKMQALREVKGALLTDDVQVAEELGELEQLQTLLLWIDINCGSNVLSVLATSLGKLSSLRALDIMHFDSNNGKMSFLYELPTTPRLLRVLGIGGSLHEGLPNWIESLTHLVIIRIFGTQLEGEQLFNILCKLPNLKSITMGPKCCRGEVIVARESHIFPVLSNLDIEFCSYDIHFERGSMEKLETLRIDVSDNNKDLVGIKHLPNLREVHLRVTQSSPPQILDHALYQLKAENEMRSESNRFKIVVKRPYSSGF